MTAHPDVDAYVASLRPEAATVVTEIRRRVHEAVPDAGETISYGIVGFTRGGRVFVHVAGWKAHVSIYPLPELDDATQARAEAYRSGRSTLKLPLAQEIPYDLVTQLVVLLAEQRTA